MDTTVGEKLSPLSETRPCSNKNSQEECFVGRGYKQTGPVINESIGNGHVFDHPASPDLSLIIFFHLEWAPAASSRTYNFAKIISVPHLPRIFIANTLTDRFHGPWKIPHYSEHIILSNKISSIGIVKPVCYVVSNNSSFSIARRKLRNRPQSFDRGTLLLSNEKNTLKFRIKVSLNPILSLYSIISR